MNDVTVYSAVPFEALSKFLEADDNNMAICPHCGERRLKLRNYNGLPRFHCEIDCPRSEIAYFIDLWRAKFSHMTTCAYSDVFREIKKVASN